MPLKRGTPLTDATGNGSLGAHSRSAALERLSLSHLPCRFIE